MATLAPGAILSLHMDHYFTGQVWEVNGTKGVVVIDESDRVL